MSPYSSNKAHRKGDILTIVIEETSQASHTADTSTSKRSSLEGGFNLSWDRLASALGDNTNISGRVTGADRYDGTGKTTRKSLARATISVIVQEVLANGNLYITGQHNVNINAETQVITVEGVVRPRDISDANTISSSKIANAKISIDGRGPINAKQNPGILTRILNWIFWFFLTRGNKSVIQKNIFCLFY